MTNYIIRRLLLIIPTLLGIMIINFAIIQVTPGGPVDQAIAKYHSLQGHTSNRLSTNSGDIKTNSNSNPRLQGLDPEIIAEIKNRYGFNKPAHIRFLTMLKNYLTFNFGKSFFSDKSVIKLIIEKLPVSISLGLWSTLIIYSVSIPLGISKAMRNSTPYDVWSSAAIIIGYAIPGFLFAVLLIVLFAGGRYWQIFPLRGLVSDDWQQLSIFAQILDYFHHLALPILSLVIGGFATLTLLTKNSFLEEMQKQYVMTARSKGLSQKQTLYRHIFRNAMLIIIAGFPSAFIGMLFTGALLVEVIFSLDGLGLLGFNSVVNRDYPVFFAILYLFTLLGLGLNLLSDIVYTLVDPRISFASAGAR